MLKIEFAIVLFFVPICYADDKPQPVAREEAAAVRELRKTGASIEFDAQGHAVSFFLMWSETDDKFTDAHLKHVAELSHLKELWLEHTSVTDSGLEHLKTMKQLETLGLICKYETGKPAKITDCGLKHLKELTNLRMLRLEDSDVTDCGLVHLRALTKLEDLSLFGTEISDAGLKQLRGLKNLTYLDVAETQWEKEHGAITVEAVNALRKYLPRCKIDY